MRQYELAIRIAQVHHLVDERKYKKALAVIQTLDMRQVRSLSDLKVFAEVYTKTEQYEAAKATYLRIYKRSRTRRILYRLIYLSIRSNTLDDAEMFYQEFVRMNANMRDALILRYRIDKAKGTPIGKLIEILQELKQEEYIEEWAYELAKLYHRAGRREECLEECHDIILWFGSGEIVERAKKLIDHLEEHDPIPYMDDKDFTVPKREEPNPDDTGSLPDLNEYIKSGGKKNARYGEHQYRARTRRDENNQEQDSLEEEEETLHSDVKEETLLPEEEKTAKISADVNEQKTEKKVGVSEKISNEFIDDYEEDDFDIDGIDITRKAKDGIQKLSGFLKKGNKKEEEVPVAGKKAERKEMPRHSQSGTGITQDLAREIAAIYEAEHREQLKEKAVTVINEVPNLATSVVDRMTQALQQKSTKNYIPLDIEEIQRDTKDLGEERFRENRRRVVEEPISEEELEQEQKILEEEERSFREMEEREERLQEAAMQNREVTTAEEEFYEQQEEASAEEFSEETVVEENTVSSEEVEEMPAEVMEDVSKENVETSEESETPMEEAGESTEEIYRMEETLSEESEEALPEEEMLTKEPEEALPEEEVLSREPEETLSESEETPTRTETLTEESRQESVEKGIPQGSILDGYQAPDIPVVTNEFGEMPELTYEDLPTTRALHQSFDDILTLIEGELDPSHFVLVGEGNERIIGVTKKIVRVMKNTGYLSKGRIAKVQARQLNKMDLEEFQAELKGNCLLVAQAADLLFPTITRIFKIMEDYEGDFVVVLSDEGATLDQLFRFVPTLAMHFKYIIDISEYNQRDYE